MTTITSNGHFLIADKRASITHVSSVGNQAYMQTAVHHSQAEQHVKIFSDLADAYSVNGERVVAYATSGSATAAETFMRAAKGFELRVFAKAYVTLRVCTGDNDSFALTCVTENRKTVKLSLTVEVKDNVIARYYTTSYYKPGEICISGSGFGLLRSMINAGAMSKESLNAHHPLNVHMFAAGLDRHSNSDYDAYSAEEDKLVVGLKPDPETIQGAVDLIASEFKFKHRSK